jgi:hypothetical protein
MQVSGFEACIISAALFFAKDGVFVALSPTSTRDERGIVRKSYANIGEYDFCQTPLTLNYIYITETLPFK